MVGDYLFTDEDFISNLSTEKPGIFKKIYEEIKYLVKVATAGSKEAKQLEKVKRAFEKAYKQNSNSTDSEAKYSLEKTTDGIEYVKTEKDMFVKKDGTPLTEKEIFTSLIDKEIELSDGKLRIVNRLPDKYMYDELFKRRPYYKGVDDIKQLNSEINYNMKEVLSNSNLKKANIPDVDNKHIRQGIESFDTRTVNFYDGNKAYTLDLSIANLSDGEKIAYAKKMVKFNEELTKKIKESEAMGEKSQLNQNPLSENRIPQNTEKSSGSTKYSISEDNKGRTLTKEQQEYFNEVSPLIKDEQGQLMVLYHQTDADFTEFDTYHEGAGSFDHETPYGVFLKPISQDIGIRGQKQMSLYALIKNPLQVRNRAELVAQLSQDEAYYKLYNKQKDIDREYHNKFEQAKNDFRNYLVEWRKNNPDASRTAIYEDEGFQNVQDNEENIVEEWTDKSNEVRVKAKERLTEYLKEKGYDGLIIEQDVGSFGRSTKTIIAFDSSQVKRIDNTKSTSNSDIRYSLSEDNENIAPVGNYNVHGKELLLEAIDDIRNRATSHETTDNKPSQPAKIQNDYTPNPEVYETEVTDVDKLIDAKIENYKVELESKLERKEETHNYYNQEIARKQSILDKKKNKATKVARDLADQIERLKRNRDNADVEADKQINALKERIDKMGTKEYRTGLRTLLIHIGVNFFIYKSMK